MPQVRKNLDKLTNRVVQKTKPSMILALSKEFKAIDDIVLLTIGEPDFNTPEHVKQAAIADIQANDSHYGPSRGTAVLLANAAKFLKDRYGLDYDPKSELLTTIGVTEGIFDTMKTLLNPGDEVIIPQPAFPVYAAAATVCGAKVVSVATVDDGFRLTPAGLTAALAEHPLAKAIVIATPGNPTGVAYSEEQIAALAEILEKHDIFVISDEIYSELSYDRPHVSFAKALPGQTILFNGVSKSHAMTGYRLGIVAGPAEIISQLAAIHELITTTQPNVVMAAGAEAFGPGENDAAGMRDEYKKRRAYLMSAFDRLGLTYAYPDGAFYFFIKIPDYLEQDGFKLARQIANEAKVGLTPGVAFGQAGYMRISYATSLDQLKLAIQRLTVFLTAQQAKSALDHQADLEK